MSQLTEAKPRAAAAVVGGVLAVLVVTIGAFLVFGGGDDTDGPDAADPAVPSASTSTTSAPQSAAATATPAPLVSVPYERQARRASREGFPALVPSDLPAGWAATGVEYDGGSQPTWHLEITTGQGKVVSLDQGIGKVATLVGQVAPGAAAGGDVDLSRWQTGVWSSYATGASFVVAKELATTTALVSGSDRTAVLTLAKRLLTMETDGGGEGD